MVFEMNFLKTLLFLALLSASASAYLDGPRGVSDYGLTFRGVSVVFSNQMDGAAGYFFAGEWYGNTFWEPRIVLTGEYNSWGGEFFRRVLFHEYGHYLQWKNGWAWENDMLMEDNATAYSDAHWQEEITQ